MGPALSHETLGHLENANLNECRCGASGRRKFTLGRDLLRSPATTEGDRRAANSGPQGCQPRDQTPDGVSGETGLENMPRQGVPLSPD
jgi:hypothetical protein